MKKIMEKAIISGLTFFFIVILYIDGGLCVCLNSTHFKMTGTSNTIINNNWFFNCTGAKFLDMSNNQFIKVGNESFDTLWRIQELNLGYNNISVIEPEALAIMRSLEHLYIDHNELVELPLDFFINKNNLISVDLSYNNITHIPLAVFNYSMIKLDRVLLHHNQITACEPWAYVKQAIRLVDVRYNQVSTFTNDANWTYTSRTVYDEASTDLRYNLITDWRDSYLQQYKSPSVESSGIETLLVELLPDIRENPFKCDCYTHHLVKRVRASFFRWSNSEYLDITCYNPPNLRGKRAFYDVALTELVCNITNDCPAGCLCQDRPEDGILNVDCGDLNMTVMPTVLPVSPYNDIHVQLGNNEINQLSNVTYLQYVTNLSMPSNFLTEIPDFVMDELARKKNAMVDFRNNSLTVIPKGAQNIKFENTQFQGNNLECSCEMLWMVEWINLAPRYADKSLSCKLDGKVYKITDLNEDILECNEIDSVILIVILSLVLVVVIALLITAKRCPYETKVLIFKIFRIHPSDKYEVDNNADKSYDMYVSFDDDDPYVTQWVKKVLFKQLEEKKPRYKLSVYQRNGPPGPEADSRLQLIDESKRLLIILSENYENHTWCEYELCHSETLEQNEGRIIYLLYDKVAEEISKKEPWLSKMKDRKVFKLHEKMFWSKIRYELPMKRISNNKPKPVRQPEYANINV
ncbi:toll-like receptor 2 [Ruditapes philippinarum]|uniref:toll-like receptor 2 n=1 Tax=Ruditapes philippinarum TaxID=129788 RepID=UPI00295B94C5|nr:toll-like receptor 2 [Ruditapes philippinarum]XP_060562234.1 toll-like receptor 2 [Ruditapes philippinarum]